MVRTMKFIVKLGIVIFAMNVLVRIFEAWENIGYKFGG